MTTTAIIGVGNMGKGLASRLAGKTSLVLGTRDVTKVADFAKSLGGDVAVASFEDAARTAEVVILALPYGAALAFASNPVLKGKIVVDISNPVTADYSGLALGFTTSAAEEIQKTARDSKVVKAFNTIFASLFAARASETANVPVFVAGDDAGAVETVVALAKSAGFAAETVGALDGARLIEPVGMLNIRFGFGLGKGTDIAPSWIKLAA